MAHAMKISSALCRTLYFVKRKKKGFARSRFPHEMRTTLEPNGEHMLVNADAQRDKVENC